MAIRATKKLRKSFEYREFGFKINLQHLRLRSSTAGSVALILLLGAGVSPPNQSSYRRRPERSLGKFFPSQNSIFAINETTVGQPVVGALEGLSPDANSPPQMRMGAARISFGNSPFKARDYKPKIDEKCGLTTEDSEGLLYRARKSAVSGSGTCQLWPNSANGAQ